MEIMNLNEESLQLVPVNDEELYDEDDDELSEDKDESERNVNQLERKLLEFRDEPHITHNVVPETDDDEEDECWDANDEEDEGCEDEGRSSHRQRNRENFSYPDGLLSDEMVFFNAAGFKEAIAKYVIKTGYNLRQYRYDKTKCAFKCLSGRGCAWRIYCSRTGTKDEWRIRVFHEVHSCSPNGKCHMMKVPVVARLFLDRIRDEPDYFMPAKMEELIKAEWKVRVSRHQCQAARKKAMRWIEKEYDDQFYRLRDYGAEILHANPNTTVEIETIKNRAGEDVFSRFYVCFEQLRRSWKNTCRRLIGIDGCFLRGKMKGELLVALGRDGNNQIYPIAWRCVQVENTENWLWFIRKIKYELELEDWDGYIIISDRHKGLLRAVQVEIPMAEHRMCVRHVYANLKKKHGKKIYMKPLVWSLAWSYNEVEYAKTLGRILEYDRGVYEDILKTNPTTWCRAFYKLGNCCEDVENNSVESFNASIVKAREKAFVPMLETIRRLAMVRIATRYHAAIKHKGLCTPYVEDFLAKELHDPAACSVQRSTNGMYEVLRSGCSFRVNLEGKTCSCKKFDICGIPCEHAYAVIIFKQLDPHEFVAHWFRIGTWRRTYQEGILPLRGPAFWPSTNYPNVYKPCTPSMPSRPKKDKRKKVVNESPTKKQQPSQRRIIHYKTCGAPGHNSRFHKSSAGESSQSQIILVESSQDQLSQSSLDISLIV